MTLPDYRELLLNLLAVIHRDGGHYVDAHGIEKACEDAEKKVFDWLSQMEDIDS